MLVGTQEILDQAVEGGFAVGAFNVYNLEGAKAVVQAAEQELLPVIIQIHPTSILTGSKTLSALCLEAAKEATVLVSVHLDHSDSEDAIKASLIAGIRSVMADGSSLKFEKVALNLKINNLLDTMYSTFGYGYEWDGYWAYFWPGATRSFYANLEYNF